MFANRITHLGYAAIAKANVRLVRPPKVLAKVPVRLSAGVGLVYFTSSFILIQAGGAPKELLLPLLGIGAAFGTFVYRTVTLVAGWAYRRRLRTYARRGVVVFVPLALVQYVEGMYEKQGCKMAAGLFDADLEKTAALVELYEQEGFSPKIKKMLQVPKESG